MAIRIYIVEDHPLIREMLCEYLMDLPDLEADVCGVAASGEEALEQLADAEADLVLVDMSLPGMSGVDMVKAVRERWPGLRCVMLSGHGEAPYIKRALTAGARGYILKGHPYEMAGAILQVLGGEVYLSEPLRGDQPA